MWVLNQGDFSQISKWEKCVCKREFYLNELVA